jgi:3-oxoacyl-[acyl-carrier-protein] synthase II
VDHVNAHATGTPVGDLSEATAIEEVLGTGVSVTAPKSAIGHLFGGAGAVETIIAVKTIEDGVIPATLNLDEPDPQIHVDVVSGTPRRQEVRVALNNSFGFGGQNVTLALTK